MNSLVLLNSRKGPNELLGGGWGISPKADFICCIAMFMLHNAVQYIYGCYGSDATYAIYRALDSFDLPTRLATMYQ